MFDSDCDGKLSREELVTAITHLQSMGRGQNGPHPHQPKTLLAATALNGSVVTNHNTSATSGESGDELDGVVEDVVGTGGGGTEEMERAEDIADSALKDHGSENVCTYFAGSSLNLLCTSRGVGIHVQLGRSFCHFGRKMSYNRWSFLARRGGGGGGGESKGLIQNSLPSLLSEGGS